MAKNKKVWKYYVDGKEVSETRALKVAKMNQRYLDLITENPYDEFVPLWQSRIRLVDKRKEYQW